MSRNKLTAIYCRVSTDMQRERESIEVQRIRLKDYSEKLSFFNLKEYIDDGYSAGSLNRPEIKKLIEDVLAKKIETVLVTSMDRLARNMSDSEYLRGIFEKNDVRLMAINRGIDTNRDRDDESLDDESFYAQKERQRTRSRVRCAMQQRAKDGKWNGGPVPYGFTTFGLEAKRFQANGYDQDNARVQARKICSLEKKLYLNKIEAETLQLMATKFIEFRSYIRVRKYLNEKNILNREGKYWANSSIKRLLTSPLYVGLIRYGVRRTPRTGEQLVNVPSEKWQLNRGLHEPIFSHEICDQVKAIFSIKKQNRVRINTAYLLSGLLKCGKCGRNMQGKSTRKKNGIIHAYYRCYSREQKGFCACDTTPVEQYKIENLVVQTILELYKNQKVMEMKQALLKHNKRLVDARFPIEQELTKLKDRNAQIGKKEHALWELVEEKTISSIDFKNRIEKLKEESMKNNESILICEERLNETKTNQMDESKIEKFIYGLSVLWNKANENQKRNLLNYIVKEIRFSSYDAPLQIVLRIVGDIDRKSTGSWLQLIKSVKGKLLVFLLWRG